MIHLVSALLSITTLYEISLNLYLNHIFFIFNEVYYKQVFETPLGPVISSTAPNFVYAINKLTFFAPFIKKNVDDFLLALPIDELDAALQIFNSYNTDIQFHC